MANLREDGRARGSFKFHVSGLNMWCIDGPVLSQLCTRWIMFWGDRLVEAWLAPPISYMVYLIGTIIKMPFTRLGGDCARITVCDVRVEAVHDARHRLTAFGF